MFSDITSEGMKIVVFSLDVQTFNEFFIRELKPGVRPIAYEERDDIAICAADCRLMAFRSIDDGLRFWIKVKFTSFPLKVLATLEAQSF